MPARSALLVSVLAAALLSGCSGSDAAPKVLPPVTPTPTMSPVPVASVPAAARAYTPQGAAAFVRFFFESLDEAYQAGRPYPLGTLADARCQSCRNFASVADDLARQGHRFAGPSFTNISAEAPGLQGSQLYVTFACNAPARTEVDSSGKVVESFPDEGRLRMTVVLLRRQSDWQLRAFRIDK